MFQSTPSGGKATSCSSFAAASIPIVSIHAFRGEGDVVDPKGTNEQVGFNPRLPGGRRQQQRRRRIRLIEFQSTPSGGKATFCPYRSARSQAVSIHAFRGEGDRWAYVMAHCFIYVSIHAFRGEGDRPRANVLRRVAVVSIHAFRGEGDRRCAALRRSAVGFNPRLPGGRRP